MRAAAGQGALPPPIRRWRQWQRRPRPQMRDRRGTKLRACRGVEAVAGLGQLPQRRHQDGIQPVRHGPGQDVHRGAPSQRRIDGVEAGEQIDDEPRFHRGHARRPGRVRRIAHRLARQGGHQPGRCVRQRPPALFRPRRPQPGQQAGTGGGQRGGGAGDDGLGQLRGARRRQAIERGGDGGVVGGGVTAADSDLAQEPLDRRGIAEPGQQRQHPCGLAWLPAGRRLLFLAIGRPAATRPTGDHVPGQVMRFGRKCRTGVRSTRRPASGQLVEIRQGRPQPALAQHPEAAVGRPEHQRRPPVSPLERRAFIAGRAMELFLVRREVLQRARRGEFVVLGRDRPGYPGAIVGAAPLRQRHAAVAHLAGLEIVVIVVVPVPAPGTGVLGDTAFLDGQQRQMHVAACLRCCGPHHPGHRRIDALEGWKAQLGRGVGMFQQVDQLGRRAVGRVPPGLQQGSHPGLFACIAGRLRRLAAARAHQVVDQGQAAAFGERQDFVHAVGVEGGETRFGRIVPVQVQPDAAVLVTDHQFAAGEQRRQHDHQRAEHAWQFLGIAVAEEEAARLVEQQLVQRRGDRGLHAEAVGYPGENTLQSRCPAFAAQAHLFWADLPTAPYCRVEDRFFAAAIRCRLGHRRELRRLHRQQRQCHRADALDLERGRAQLGGAGAARQSR